MKDDYLWDKSGEDFEIERLENALQEFRFKETEPPALPQNVFTLEEKRPTRWSLRFGLAFAAFASLLIVFALLWFQLKNETLANSAGEVAKIDATRNFEKPSVKTVATTAVSKVEDSTGFVKPTSVKIRAANNARFVKTSRREVKAKQVPSETLTAEEKEAYDQLMLALSITGSKLRLVKDAVQGIDEQSAVLETTK